MAVESIEFAVEDVLKEASPLAALDGISLHRLEVTVWRISSEYLYQPLSLGIRAVAMRIDFSRQIINASAFSFGILRIFQIKQGRRRNGRLVF